MVAECNNAEHLCYVIVIKFESNCVIRLLLGLVLWDERQQRERRQEGVKYRLNSIQQKKNMEEYELQRIRYEEYKAAHS